MTARTASLLNLLIAEHVPLLQALELAGQELGGDAQISLDKARDRIAEGHSFADAAAQAPDLFPVPLPALIGAAETTGTVDRLFERIAARPHLFEPDTKNKSALLLHLSDWLSIGLEVGMPLIDGLTAAATATPNPQLATILRDAADALSQGADLGPILAEHRDWFPPAYAAAVDRAAMAGNLERTFGRLADALRDGVLLAPA